jgi:hypothetical protein
MATKKPDAPELPVLSVEELVDKMRVPFALSCASRRNTGKTFYISHLINALVMKKKIDYVLVMSNTIAVNDDYKFLPPALRQPYNEGIIRKLMKRQADIPKAERKQVLLVCDDVLTDKEAEKSRLLKKLFVMGRHFDISIVLASQSANGFILTPTIKNNSDFILFSRLNRHHLINLYEALTNIDKKEFISFAERHNRDFVFLCVDNTSQSTDPSEFILLTKAKQNAEPKKSKHKIYKDAEEDWSDESESSG